MLFNYFLIQYIIFLVQVHKNIFPDAAVQVIGAYIERGTSFYHVQFHTFVYNNFFHGIMIDYVTAHQLAYAQEEGIEIMFDDYAFYLNRKAEDDRKNLGTKSFQGVDPYDQEEALVTDYVLDCSRISEEVPRIQQQGLVRPKVQQILEQGSKGIETEISVIQLQTPTRQSMDERFIQETAEIQLFGFGNGVSFIADKKIVDVDVNGVDVNSLDSEGHLSMQESLGVAVSVMLRGLIDDLLGPMLLPTRRALIFWSSL